VICNVHYITDLNQQCNTQKTQKTFYNDHRYNDQFWQVALVDPWPIPKHNAPMLAATWPRTGWMNALKMTLQLKPGGLLVGGPPCSSWVWINRATSKRSKVRILGDSSREYVRLSNQYHGSNNCIQAIYVSTGIQFGSIYCGMIQHFGVLNQLVHTRCFVVVWNKQSTD